MSCSAPAGSRFAGSSQQPGLGGIISPLHAATLRQVPRHTPASGRLWLQFAGGDSGKHGGAILPGSLRWLWRDYQPPAKK
ncbi:MAG TPA: hypothetical protein VHC22_17715 [Pirellulales bacterium]|nr:hypothetical protein [Pirellulales bacterium]